MDGLPALGEHAIELDGVRQAYDVAGEGPVCIVHSGGPGIHPDYLRMPLLERHMTLVYLDPIGTGRSGLLPGGDHAVSEYARYVELLLSRLDTTEVFFLGHSHGGFVGLQYALDHPERLRGLIVYDSAPMYTPELTEEASRQMALFAGRWPDRPEAAEAARVWTARRTGELSVTDRASHVEYLSGILPAYFADFRRTVESLGGRPALDVTHDPARRPYEWDVRDRLASIVVPTLVISGRHDFICPPVWAREMHAKIPEARLAEFADSGHFAHIEQPEDFVDSVLAFVHGAGDGARLG